MGGGGVRESLGDCGKVRRREGVGVEGLGRSEGKGAGVEGDKACVAAGLVIGGGVRHAPGGARLAGLWGT
jgi:hypothetical protein